MFAILVEDTLYLKADEVSARDFAGEVPERLLDDPEELVTWARRAHAVALAAKAEKR